MKNILKSLGIVAIWSTVAGAGMEFGKRLSYRIAVRREAKKAEKLLAEIEKNRANE